MFGKNASPPAALRPLVPHPPALHDPLRWLELAEMFRRQHTEFAADALDFTAVLKRSANWDDFDEAERRLGGSLISRVASGYDVHAFGPGDHVWIGGVRIDHDRGLVGHSDADAALHALTDALLGVVSDGDIGAHFPPSDPQWSGASSDRFLNFAASRVREQGGVIDHLDLTIVCEAPKIGPHRDLMRTRIADIAEISTKAVSVKATTSEQLGFTGRREGLAAYATATTRLPDRDAA